MATPERPTPPPRPKLGGQTKAAAAPLRGGKGFVPPPVHRQKVEVARAHETPQAPPTIEPVAAAVVSSPKVVAKAPPIGVPVTPAPPAAGPRVKPVRIPPKAVVEEPPVEETIVEPVVEVPVSAGVEPSVKFAEPAEEKADMPPEETVKAPSTVEPYDKQDPHGVFAEPVAGGPLDVAAVEIPEDAPSAALRPPAIFMPVQVRAESSPASSVDTKQTPGPIADDAPIPEGRPMLRYYLGGAVGLFFLLIAALIAGLWVHSFGAIDRALYATFDGKYTWIESSAGAIYFHIESDPSPVARQADVWRMEMGDAYKKDNSPPPTIPGAALQGVTIARVPAASGASVQYVVISYWLVVIPLTLPGLWWLRNRRRLRVLCRTMRCLGCGYNLRHSPDRCPECGMPGPRSAQVAADLQREFERQ